MTDPQASNEADRLAADLLPTRMDELAMEGRTDTSVLNELWAMAFALPRWYFVGTGKFPNVQPLAVIVDKKPFAMAFTAKGRADEYLAWQSATSEAMRGVLEAGGAGAGSSDASMSTR